ncbi:MAG TPA: hypothetical protein VK453_10565 [Micromonosporaceae bacterium]|nr:hypothetical protein [Micromonosporaceae bacterium]
MGLNAQNVTRGLRFGLRAVLVSAVMATGVVAVATPAQAASYANLMVTPDRQSSVGSYKFIKYDARGNWTMSRCIKAVYGRWESTNIKFLGDGIDKLTVRQYGDAACQSWRGETNGTTFGYTSGSNWWHRVRMFY